jgi:hypothetical protein
MIEAFRQVRAAAPVPPRRSVRERARGHVSLPRFGTTGEMKGLVWTHAGPSRSWKTAKIHVGTAFADAGAVYLVAPSKGVTRVGETPLGPRAHVGGKRGSATQSAMDRIADRLACAADLGICAIAGFSGGCPYSAREFAKTYL